YLDVVRGEIFAFLGPNGAGKTTTVEILEGFRTRSAGEVSVLGIDPARAGGAWRDRVGAVLQESQPEIGLTVRECLRLYAGYYSKPRDIAETIGLVGLEGKADALAEQLSGGQRRRLDVALALIGDPELIFLDEPTTGFDPSARRTAWGVVTGLRQLGKTVFLTTHYMDEAENLADRIAVIANGRIVAEGTPGTLGGRERMAALVRNRQARFFTLVLPILFLVIFVSVFGNDRIGPQHVKASTYYVPGLAALGVIAGSFVNLVISITAQREAGILKRRRSTPVPAWVLIAGRALVAIVVALAVMTVLLLIGRFAYGVHLPSETLPGVVLTGIVGAVTFCCLGYALSTAIRSADAAQPMVQAIMLPLYFISGVFIPNVSLPHWLQD